MDCDVAVLGGGPGGYTAAIRAAQLEQFQAAQGQLSNALSRLLVVVERYPELKANQNFLQLQSELGDALLLLIEGIYVTGQQSEEGPAQSAVTVAKLLIDVSVPKT